MARRAEETRSYQTNINYFADKCRTIDGSDLRVTLKSENPTEDGGVWFRIHHGMSAASYGEKITVTLTPAGSGTTVHVLSECGMPTQLVDYGKNKSNVQAVFRYLEEDMQKTMLQPKVPVFANSFNQSLTFDQMAGEEAMGYKGTGNAAPAANAQADAAPSGSVIYCTNCGKQLPAQAKFCSDCGTKLQ